MSVDEFSYEAVGGNCLAGEGNFCRGLHINHFLLHFDFHILSLQFFEHTCLSSRSAHHGLQGISQERIFNHFLFHLFFVHFHLRRSLFCLFPVKFLVYKVFWRHVFNWIYLNLGTWSHYARFHIGFNTWGSRLKFFFLLNFKLLG